MGMNELLHFGRYNEEKRMRKIKLREYSYTILLAASLVMVVCIWCFGGLQDRKMQDSNAGIAEIDVMDVVSDLVSGDKSSDAVITSNEHKGLFARMADKLMVLRNMDGYDFFALFSNIGKSEERAADEVINEITDSEIENAGAEGSIEIKDEVSRSDGNISVTDIEATDAESVTDHNMTVSTGDDAIAKLEENVSLGMEGAEIYQADSSYFDDALFIGDSRTVGLYEYGGLGNAEVCADSGMNIYKVFQEEFTLSSGEVLSLEEILMQKQFGKVYIMLGINELGYDFDQTVKKFAESIEKIQECQPDALVFIMANLHITKEKSEESEYFTNENIDRFNAAVGAMADGERIFYLDVNSLYDDEEGGLSTEYTTDHAHILGKYYTDWVDFILQNAVRVENHNTVESIVEEDTKENGGE